MDLSLFNLINGFADKWVWLDFLGIFFAQYSAYILILLMALFLIIRFKNYWKMVLEAFAAGILARFIIVPIIRFFWQRERPFDLIDVNLLLKLKNEVSFPSGHAVFYFAVSTIVYFYNKKLGYLFFAVSVLMGLARIFVGYHWPSDILAGAVIGIFSGWLIDKIFKKYFFRNTP